MTDFFDKTYSSIISKNELLDRIRFYSLCRFLTRELANVVLPIYYRFSSSPKLLQRETTSPLLIVSLTTIPSRIDKLWLTLESILRQTYQPDKIIVWLSKEDFCNDDSLPNSLKRMRKLGVDFRYVDENYRSHRKYYYTLQEFPNDNIVTLDDDIFYNTHLLSALMSKHQLEPNAVVAAYTHQITYSKNGEIRPYPEWKRNVVAQENLFFGSGGGTLFPPRCMSPHVLNIQKAMQLCPKADDVWLNAMARLKKTPIVRADFYSVILPVLNRKTTNLSASNINQDNDIQIQAVMQYIETIE